MSEQTQTLRTVADFARVPPDQLLQCLQAFKGWLHGRQPTDQPRQEFVWAPRASHGGAGAPDRRTSLRDIGLHPGAVRQFEVMGVHVIEDLARLSQVELGRVVHVGPRTVARIVRLLADAGLEPRENAPPALRGRSEVLLQLAREHVGDATGLDRLALKPQTLRKLAALGVRTVGELRDLRPADLASALSLQRRHEVFRSLRVLGIALRCNPGELELWRAGLLRADELRAPDDAAGVCELQPWLGTLAQAAEDAGIRTVGELRRLARAGVVHGAGRRIGPSSWARIRRHFGMSPRDTLWPEPLRLDQAHADREQREAGDVVQLEAFHEMAAMDVDGL